MAELKLTKSRLELLAAIARGEVWESYEACMVIWENAEHGQRAVTRRAKDLEGAGWAGPGSSRWKVTPKGEEILVGAASVATADTTTEEKP